VGGGEGGGGGDTLKNQTNGKGPNRSLRKQSTDATSVGSGRQKRESLRQLGEGRWGEMDKPGGSPGKKCLQSATRVDGPKHVQLCKLG